MAPIIRNGKLGIQNGKLRFPGTLVLVICSFIAFSGLFSLPALGQLVPTCSVGSTATVVHAEGLAEQLGDVILTCAGGTQGSAVTANVFVALNTNITNRVDAAGHLLSLSVTADTGAGPLPVAVPTTLYSPVTLFAAGVQYTVPTPNTQPVTIDISGLRAAVPDVTGGASLVTATVFAAGVQVSSAPKLVLATGPTSLLDSVINNGALCGSPAPATLDFPGLLAATTGASTIRITEAYASAFLPKMPTADTGVRILVNLMGYGSGTTLYVPDAIVGTTGSTPTSGGGFSSSYSGGVYTPGSNQLLLVRVNNADATGAGGTLVLAAPAVTTTFGSVSQVTLSNGAGYAVYEVVDSNPNFFESAQIPVFVAAPQGNCAASGQPVLTPELAPLSNVSVGTQTDPIPRFIANTPSPDCHQIGDCGAAYFPQLGVTPAAINLTGFSMGKVQSTFDQVVNAGSGQLTFNISISAGAHWLSVTPTSGTNNTRLTVTADPSTLAPGVYTATMTISAGSAGTTVVPVTFDVAAPIPELVVAQTTVTLSATAAGAATSASVKVTNANPGTGQLTFNASIAYPLGNPSNINWLSVSPVSGTDNTTLTLTANPASLNAGVYQATVIVNGGSAGTAIILVTFNVTPAVLTFVPVIQSVVNSANFLLQPFAPNSFVSIFGLNLVAKNTLSVTFNGAAATVYYDGQPSPASPTTQVNVLVPASLGSAATASVVVVVDGQASSAFIVSLVANAPAIFAAGILNQNNSLNLSAAPASPGDIVQIFLTGLATPIAGLASVNIAGQIVSNLVYAGPAPTLTGVEQVDVAVPANLAFSGASVPISVCIPGTGSQPLCSAPVNLYLKPK